MVSTEIVVYSLCAWIVMATDGSQPAHSWVDDNAIYQSAAKAATATSFLLEHTRIIITKASESIADSFKTHQVAPRIVVVDAAARHLLCLPKSQLSGALNLSRFISSWEDGDLTTFGSNDFGKFAADTSAAAAAAVGGSTASAAAKDASSAAAASDKSSSAAAATPGGSSAAAASPGGSSAAASTPGGGTTAAATPGGSSAAVATTGGSTAAAASPGGGTAAAASPGGGTTAAATPGGGTAAAASPGGGTAAAATPGGGTAAAATPGGGTTAAATPGGGTAAAATPGGGTAAAASPGGSTTAAATPGGGTAAAASPGGGTAAASTPGGGTAAAATPGGGTAAAASPGGGAAAAATPGGGSAAAASPGGGTTAAATPGGSAAAAATPGGSAAAAAGSAAASTANSGGEAFGVTSQNGMASAAVYGEHTSTVIGQGEGITASLADAEQSKKVFGSEQTIDHVSHISSDLMEAVINEGSDSPATVVTESSSAASDIGAQSTFDSANHSSKNKHSSQTSHFEYDEHTAYYHSSKRDCECVPAYLCDEHNYILQYGQGIIQIRFRQPTGGNTTQTNAGRRCSGHSERCCRHRPDTPRQAIAWLPERCGERSPARLDSREAGGQLTRLGEFPWMVAIIKQENETKYLCGGSLIRRDVVLTAAHCVKDWTSSHSLLIRAGEWDTTFPDPAYPHQDLPVEAVKIHPHFNQHTLFNDLALLKLTEPVQLSAHVNTICLPQQQQQQQQQHSYEADHQQHDHHYPQQQQQQPQQYDADGRPSVVSSQCFTTGWGKESFDAAHYSSILKVAAVSVVPHDSCQHALRSTRLGRWFRLHETFMCAGGAAGVDACTGDGGSPLVCPGQDGRWQQVGVVAWGIGCGRSGVPGVYANVAPLLPWIEQNVAALTADIEF